MNGMQWRTRGVSNAIERKLEDWKMQKTGQGPVVLIRSAARTRSSQSEGRPVAVTQAESGMACARTPSFATA